MGVKIGVLGCKFTTLKLISALHKNHAISVVYTLTNQRSNLISGFDGYSIGKYCDANKIKMVVVDDYQLKNDEILFAREKLDLLFVIGWERLLPNKILSSIKFGCFGMHGSYRGLPYGKGRSPMNWALITGKKKFITHLFRYDVGIDSGEIYGTETFDILSLDTIKDLHLKNCDAMINLSEKLIENIRSGQKLHFITQNNRESTFYPKRNPDDGEIDWNASSELICRFVNALSSPYPPSFSHVHDGLLRYYFETCLSFSDRTIGLAPGQYKSCNSDSSRICVGTNKGYVELEVKKDGPPLAIHGLFKSANYEQQIRAILLRSDQTLTYENLDRSLS